MMADAEEGSLGAVDHDLFNADDDCDDVYIDLDSFWRVMGGASTDQGEMVEDLSSIDVPQGVHNSKDMLSPEILGSSVLSPSHNSEVSDSRTGSSDGFSESVGTSSIIVGAGMVESFPHSGIVEHQCSRTVTDCISVQENCLSHICMVDGPQSKTPSYFPNHGDITPCGTPSHSGPLNSSRNSCVTHDGESSAVCQTNHDQDLFECSRLDFPFENTEDASIIDGEMTPHDASHNESSSCEIKLPDVPGSFPENGGINLFELDDPPYVSFSSGFQPSCDGNRMVNAKDEVETSNEDFVCLMPSVDLSGSQFCNHMPENGTGGCVPSNGLVGFSYVNDMITMQDESKDLSPNSFFCIFNRTEDDMVVNKNVQSIRYNEIEVVDEVISRKSYGDANKLTSIEGIQWSSSDSSLIPCKNYVSSANDEKDNGFVLSDFLPSDIIGETNPPKVAIDGYDFHLDRLVSGQPVKRPFASIKAEMNYQNMDYDVSKFNSFYRSNITCPGIQSTKIDYNNLDDDDDIDDLCILEDLSTPAVASNGNMFAASRFSTPIYPIEETVTGNSGLRQNNLHVNFRTATEDLSQPTSVTDPPDGVLAVPLLKHQRIALSWMVNKETKGEFCSGGILADDQGLGKTVSTISLILTERSPSSKAPITNMGQCKLEMYDLDEDNGASETYYVEDSSEINRGKTYIQTKGKPSAGTLIVCPTSVLRQWSEEFNNKVTREADLSVLVYHGSNRTKDPLELAKYDVVVTTYAIVSMEVPKQPVTDENDDQMANPYKEFSSNKKRKVLDTASSKKSARRKKSNKGIDNKLLETISGPLAKVGWFRVVLDEAQTIKNHRTQVARACWGLRAKRRWCLSGTPIQNAIDDLYSYFKFLRHYPYATFNTFCEHIKSPIQKNPEIGYQKLRAVLKTIMLRRTKGSLIDGEPIVNIPPKTVELKRVEFSMEERDFYCRLEADSQEQFAVYANEGTVKQNYVNILLMLLRLRQACDHPLLVRESSSTSQITSSIEMAKKLPPEKKVFLLNCLEASLAICGICSDPPEDAIVTVCGHVFCNQCICQHMIGDEMQCPNKSCKTRLSLSYIFSHTALRGAMSDHPNPLNNQTASCSDKKIAKVSESCSLNYPEGSSKIKAALELLTSLSKPHVPTSKLSSSEPTEGYYGSDLFHGRDSAGGNETLDTKSDSHNPVKVMGEKAIVFSQWTRMLDLLEVYLKGSSIQYRRLDGTMPIAVRDKAVKEFTTLPEVTVMIMSLKAASLGLNMVAASHVILLDLWWNPTTEDQAIDRAHRIGQTRPVSVYRLTVKDTVEDRILALQEKKRSMVASAFGEYETGGRQSRLTVDDLAYLFQG